MTTQPTPPPALTVLQLTEDIQERVKSAYESGKPLVFAYVDGNGQPSLSMRGSTQPYSETQLAVWVRNPEGGLLKSLEANPRVTLMYRDTTPESRAMLQFRGRAHVENTPEVRKKVYESAPQAEQNADREQKGIPIIIDLDSVDGMYPGARVAMRK